MTYMEWISVDERLPILESDNFGAFDMVEVIVFDGITVESSEFSAGRAGGFWTKWEYKGVTHWMPLPEPPE